MAEDRSASGSHLRLKGLGSKPELNGRACTVLFFDTEAGRYALELADGSCIRVKPECVAPVGGAIADGRQRPATLVPSADRRRQLGQGHKSM